MYVIVNELMTPVKAGGCSHGLAAGEGSPPKHPLADWPEGRARGAASPARTQVREAHPETVEHLERADVVLRLELSDRVLTAAKLDEVFEK